MAASGSGRRSAVCSPWSIRELPPTLFLLRLLFRPCSLSFASHRPGSYQDGQWPWCSHFTGIGETRVLTRLVGCRRPQSLAATGPASRTVGRGPPLTGRTQSPALLDGFPYGIDLLSWNVSPSLPHTLPPAQVPIGAVQGPAGAAAGGFAAASPFLLRAPGLGQQTTGINSSAAPRPPRAPVTHPYDPEDFASYRRVRVPVGPPPSVEF